MSFRNSMSRRRCVEMVDSLSEFADHCTGDIYDDVIALLFLLRDEYNRSFVGSFDEDDKSI